MIATAYKTRQIDDRPKSTEEVRARAAEIRRSWSREERLSRFLQAQVEQRRLFGALLRDAA